MLEKMARCACSRRSDLQNTPMRISKTLLVAAIVAVSFSTNLRAELSPVNIRVEQPSKVENEPDKKTTTRKLKITLASNSQEEVVLKVKWALLGRDATDKEIKVVEEGELLSTVKPRGTDVQETRMSKPLVVTDAKTDPKTNKRTPAAGVKFVGYGVQVFKGEVKVAEAYDPISVKEIWGKAPAAPAAPAAK